jgi:succinate dehydrogenase hydrophobic anchor subunit
MHPNIIGALLNSALYLLCVFVAGIVTGHPIAWKLALIAMGVTYVSHIVGMRVANMEYAERDQVRPLTSAIVWLSILLGAAAGVDLLF